MSNSVVIDFYDIKHNKSLLNELIRQKKSQKHYSTDKSELEKNIENFNKAKELIKQKIIASDTSKDNSLSYAAMISFKKNK